MDQYCPHCGEKLPFIVDAFCPQCREDLSADPVRHEDLGSPIQPSDQELASDGDRAFREALAVSIVAYGALIVTLFSAGIQKKAIEAFGLDPVGMPAVVFLGLLETLLFLPMPRAFYHFGLIRQQAQRDGRSLRGLYGLLYVVDVELRFPHLSRSKWICLGSLAYCMAIFGFWIVYGMIWHI